MFSRHLQASCELSDDSSIEIVSSPRPLKRLKMRPPRPTMTIVEDEDESTTEDEDEDEPTIEVKAKVLTELEVPPGQPEPKLQKQLYSQSSQPEAALAAEVVAGSLKDPEGVGNLFWQRFGAMYNPDTNKETTESIEDESHDNMWKDLREVGFAFKAQGSAGNPMAGRWARHLKQNPDFKQRYEQAKGRSAKEHLRKEWCSVQYDEHCEAKVHTEEHSIVESKKGTMLSLHRIAVEEGGGVVGMQAAVNYALKSVKLGGPWAEFDSWTQQPKFRYVVKSDTDDFKQAWKKEKTWSARKATTAEPEQQQTPGEKKPKKETKPVTPTPDKKEKKASSGKSPLVLAQLTKKNYEQTLTKANNVLLNIKEDKAWEWANHEAMLDKVMEAHRHLAEVVASNEFIKGAILDLAGMRKVYEQELFDKHLKQFSLSLDGVVSTLDKEARKLIKQHHARLSVV